MEYSLSGALAVRIILFMCFTSQSLPNSTSSARTCSCMNSPCIFSEVCRPDSTCKRENVALGKPAEMSSRFGPHDPSGPACLAVNGNTSTVYEPELPGVGNPNCIHTQYNDSNPWWLVKLGRNYTITDISVYVRSAQPQRMDKVLITVDGVECYQFLDGTSNTPAQKNITCKRPLTGSIVRFSKKGDTNLDYYLNFCEVQVWVCKPGSYGENCDQPCSSLCKDNCDNFYGTCPAGCLRGFYGRNCSTECGHCIDDVACDTVTGKCPGGCEVGWLQPLCQNVLQQESSTIQMGTIIGAVLGISLLGSILIALFIWFRKYHTFHHASQTIEMNVSNKVSDSVPDTKYSVNSGTNQENVYDKIEEETQSTGETSANQPPSQHDEKVDETSQRSNYDILTPVYQNSMSVYDQLEKLPCLKM